MLFFFPIVAVVVAIMTMVNKGVTVEVMGAVMVDKEVVMVNKGAATVDKQAVAVDTGVVIMDVGAPEALLIDFLLIDFNIDRKYFHYF